MAVPPRKRCVVASLPSSFFLGWCALRLGGSRRSRSTPYLPPPTGVGVSPQQQPPPGKEKREKEGEGGEEEERSRIEVAREVLRLIGKKGATEKGETVKVASVLIEFLSFFLHNVHVCTGAHPSAARTQDGTRLLPLGTRTQNTHNTDLCHVTHNTDMCHGTTRPNAGLTPPQPPIQA